MDNIRLNIGQGIRSDSGTWYRNVQHLGSGGNAETYLVIVSEGVHEGVIFALKIFKKLSQHERHKKFLREIRFLKTCNHPAVMRVYDAGTYSIPAKPKKLEYPFVVAEYLPVQLLDVIRSNTASTIEKLSYALQLLSALTYLDNLNPQVVHRDIKPRNIFVKGGSCVLGDFGLIKVLNEEIDGDREVLKESTGPGMPFMYRTPDLVNYANKVGPLTTKSDVFQLGLVLAELFTGWNPLKPSDNLLAPIELLPVSHVRGKYGRGIAHLILRMLALDPQKRESAAQLLDGWSGVFKDAVHQSHELEGRAF